MGITLRPLTTGDVDAWADVLAAVEEDERTGEHFAAADLAEEMAGPEVEVGKDFVGAFDAGGEMVGYFAVLPYGVGDGHYSLEGRGGVRPARRDEGIGTLLAQAMVARAGRARDERHPELPARLVVTGGAADVAQADLLGSVGLRPERWTFVMRAALDDRLPPARPLPAGYRLSGYDASIAEAFRETHNAAFLDHPGAAPWSAARWQQSVIGSRQFRPDVCFVVTTAESDDTDRSGELVAYVLTAEFEADFEATGRREAYVDKVGTLRPHRGNGLATALLGHAMHSYRAAGYDVAALAVDSENPTGALDVYRRVGLEVESRWTNYAVTIGAPARGSAPPT